jgi:ABC-type long-subunit fatty acid transport system fused permease/ATPase subunit
MMTRIEEDFYQYMINNSTDIVKQLTIANKLKYFELNLALKSKYNAGDTRYNADKEELDNCMI